MARNLRYFETNAEYQAADLVFPAVSYVEENDDVMYDPTAPVPIKWKATYSDGSVTSAECSSSTEINNGDVVKANIESVEIGDCVTAINTGAFTNSSIKSVTIGSGITSITFSGLASFNATFGGCASLTSFTIKAITPPTISADILKRSDNAIIYVPAESLNAYKAKANWSKYASRIQAMPNN